MNARNLITLWGEKFTEGEYDDLNTYAYKQWAGMFSDYHLVRWNKFFDEVEHSLRENEKWDRADFLKWSKDFETKWSHDHKTFSTAPNGNPIEVSRQIFKKYENSINYHAK